MSIEVFHSWCSLIGLGLILTKSQCNSGHQRTDLAKAHSLICVEEESCEAGFELLRYLGSSRALTKKCNQRKTGPVEAPKSLIAVVADTVMNELFSLICVDVVRTPS